MKIAYKNLLILLALIFLIGLESCESIDLDVNDNPNSATPANSDINLLLNGAMLNFSKWLGEEDEDNRIGFEAGLELVRMLHMYGPLYENAYEPGDFDDVWRQSYGGHLSDIQTIKELASENDLFHHIGVAQILESYTLTTLVDYFGDVPYSTAFRGSDEFNPTLDDDAEVYAIALSLLDEAILNLAESPPTSIASTGDIFYFGDIDKWVTLANTLKLRIYSNTRLVDPSVSQAGINALLAEGNLIDSPQEDFAVLYGTNSSAPDIRHPQFINNYQNTPSGEYMNMYFMNLLVNGFSSGPDPRTRYYIYRQVSDFPEANAQGIFDFPCLAESYPLHYDPDVDAFCTSIGSGYWGRIHGDAQGLPSDSDKITTWGTYPIGGKFDDDSFTAVGNSSGMGGAGINPILLSSFVYFMRAEAALMLGTSDDATTMLEAGIRASMDKVLNFDPNTLTNNFASDSEDVDSYVAEILADYTDAASDEEKLNVIMTQAYIASWGNVVEAYNSYRRTGMPLDMTPTQLENSGAFIRSFKYPSVAIDNNPNISPKANQAVKVFWDLNSIDLDF
ncbi:SusD/RagB family nutrient-binding outer membrane lipoprotein [Flagellimonas nanhaiensis]|uniref:SusD/RagB family nutrient-binding outer membrane lipoprotein n=1 Tax=Flagellimonas nanhaiensis TaxID=2292706 RepID=A0A371JPC3_9FLAO|nr:SusD/RagB family nutrient-binding outer membrane lipoprotein [Allomuricauda nanhaiensis]RDY59370.1 SusD/RagB family nutrient-binding outer membrane lipoprotein [Allomuricauda nanhaiensis]